MTVIYGTHMQSGNIFRWFFHFFFKLLIFRVVRKVKVQKMVQNGKKVCLMRLVSQDPYMVWLSFMLHLCKMIISPGSFSIFFKILIFWVARGVKGQKAVRNDKKFCPLDSISQEPYMIRLSFMVHMCKIIISLGMFFIFSKFWFFGLLGG